MTLHIQATGMVVTPASLTMAATAGQSSPRAQITIDQAVAGQGAIHWYAYAVNSGDWWNIQQASAGRDMAVTKTSDGFSFAAPDGETFQLETLPWVQLSPTNGFTPGVLQVMLDMNQAPIGANRVTVLIDGGPGTLNRFQGVDVLVLINRGGPYTPLILR